MSVYFGGRGNDVLTKSSMWLAKPSAYAIDGTGRDSYINQDNGGLYRPYEPAYAPDTGTFGVKSQKRSITPSIGTKRTKYFSNGTGRDAYVV